MYSKETILFFTTPKEKRFTFPSQSEILFENEKMKNFHKILWLFRLNLNVFYQRKKNDFYFLYLKSIEAEKWKLSHENLDLKHDIDSLTSFINAAKRTGKWDTKRLQLKTIPLDRIIGVTQEDIQITTPLHKEIQYRDERIQVLQAEIEQLRKTKNDLAKQVKTKALVVNLIIFFYLSFFIEDIN